MDTNDNLKCSICLGLFQTPKILPCFHTFCQKCLQDLVDTSSNSLTCPQCRKRTSVPKGGVCMFQTNFYIADDIQRRQTTEYCPQHPEEELRYYCVNCDVPVCRDCQMLSHNGHTVKLLQEEIVLAKRDLENDERRLSNCKHKVNDALKDVKANQDDLVKQRQTIKRVVDDWEDDLITFVKQECAAVRMEAIGSVYNATEKLRFPLEQDESRLRTNMQLVESLEKEVSEALQGGKSHTILKLRKEMKTGRGSEAHLDQLSHSSKDLQPTASTNTSLLYVNNISRRDIHSLLQQVRPVFEMLKIKYMFRCGEDINEICPTKDGRVFVAHEGFDETVRATLFTSSGKTVWAYTTSAQTRAGIVKVATGVYYLMSTQYNYFHDLTAMRSQNAKVCDLTYSFTDFLFWSFWPHNILAAKRFEEQSMTVIYDAAPGWLRVLSKRNLRYGIAVKERGKCVLWSLKDVDRYFWKLTFTCICSLSCKIPTAMDADKNGKLFAVLDAMVDHVLIYRYGDKEPFATYNAAFDPRDVCFCEIGGRERLVVADWQGNSLHVLDVTEDGCKLLGRLGSDCPLLTEPSRLCPDNMGRLWVGCSGGHVLTVETRRDVLVKIKRACLSFANRQWFLVLCSCFVALFAFLFLPILLMVFLNQL